MTDDAVQTRLLFPVTSQAIGHGQVLDLLRGHHRFDRTVAGLARDLGANVQPMLEVNEVGHPGDLQPRDRFFPIPVANKLFHLWVIQSGNLVAPLAARNRRDAGNRRPARVGVAVFASDLKIARMNLVAKGNGLGEVGFLYKRREKR